MAPHRVLGLHLVVGIATILVFLPLTTLSIPIPNGQLGRTEVDCTEEYIDIVFLTEDIFQGRVFVVGHANDSNCVSREVGRRTTSITIQKNRCGVTTTRSIDPPGLFVTTKVMISFHRDFITKVDRGYEISCFFMESAKTVSYPLTVSAASLAPFTETAEIPHCNYEVLDPFTRKPLSVVSVGSRLLHKWTCLSTSPDLWCMTVHSCFIEDGSGTEFTILNEEGCAVDRFLLDNLQYGPGRLTAQKEALAIKFADRVVVNFQCSVRLDVKDGECAVPKCPDLRHQTSQSSGLKVRKRSVQGIVPGIREVDVRAGINVLDPDVEFDADALPHSRPMDCVPVASLILPASILTTLVATLGAAVVYLVVRLRKL